MQKEERNNLPFKMKKKLHFEIEKNLHFISSNDRKNGAKKNFLGKFELQKVNLMQSLVSMQVQDMHYRQIIFRSTILQQNSKFWAK